MFPSIINDNLPALESFNHSPNLALHIATLHSARRPFIACQSSEKIKQALRNNIRSSGQIYNIKDEVHYKHGNSPKWKGPAKVLGQDGPVVFLRHGTRHIKAHVCRVQLNENSINQKNDKDHPPPPTPLANQPHNMLNQSSIPSTMMMKLIVNQKFQIHTNQKIHFHHHRHNYHHLDYNYKYHHHRNYHHRNHNFKNHHYYNHHYRQKHLH